MRDTQLKEGMGELMSFLMLASSWLFPQARFFYGYI
jgi:hypothetical protein